MWRHDEADGPRSLEIVTGHARLLLTAHADSVTVGVSSLSGIGMQMPLRRDEAKCVAEWLTDWLTSTES